MKPNETNKPDGLKPVEVRRSLPVSDHAGIDALMADGFRKGKREKSPFNKRFYQVMIRIEYLPNHESVS